MSRMRTDLRADAVRRNFRQHAVHGLPLLLTGHISCKLHSGSAAIASQHRHTTAAASIATAIGQQRLPQPLFHVDPVLVLVPQVHRMIGCHALCAAHKFGDGTAIPTESDVVLLSVGYLWSFTECSDQSLCAAGVSMTTTVWYRIGVDQHMLLAAISAD